MSGRVPLVVCGCVFVYLGIKTYRFLSNTLYITSQISAVFLTCYTLIYVYVQNMCDTCSFRISVFKDGGAGISVKLSRG